MPHTKKNNLKTIRTTLGDLAAAFYEAALAELKDESMAAKVAQQMVQDALKNRRLVLA